VRYKPEVQPQFRQQQIESGDPVDAASAANEQSSASSVRPSATSAGATSRICASACRSGLRAVVAAVSCSCGHRSVHAHDPLTYVRQSCRVLFRLAREVGRERACCGSRWRSRSTRLISEERARS
jgi:hypothetical protein